jgi:hypothetical protein
VRYSCGVGRIRRVTDTWIECYRRLSDPTRAPLQFGALLALGFCAYFLQFSVEPGAYALALALWVLFGVFF